MKVKFMLYGQEKKHIKDGEVHLILDHLMAISQKIILRRRSPNKGSSFCAKTTPYIMTKNKEVTNMNKAYLVIEKRESEYNPRELKIAVCTTKKKAEEEAVKWANSKCSIFVQNKGDFLNVGTLGFDLKRLYDYRGMMFLQVTSKRYGNELSTYYMIIEEIKLVEG
jgi:hypothetical protein